MIASAAALLPDTARLVTLDCDHFSLYLDKNWDYTMQQQLGFMKLHASGGELEVDVVGSASSSKTEL